MKVYYAKTLYTMLYEVKISMGANVDLIWDKDWIKLISFNPPPVKSSECTSMMNYVYISSMVTSKEMQAT